MDIDVTSLVSDDVHLPDISGSIAEHGADAAEFTWSCAKRQARTKPLLRTDELPSFRDHMREFGAWEAGEIDAWSEEECSALMAQLAAGDLREAQSLAPGDGMGDIDWDEYDRLAHKGTLSGNLYASGGRIYYYVGT